MNVIRVSVLALCCVSSYMFGAQRSLLQNADSRSGYYAGNNYRYYDEQKGRGSSQDSRWSNKQRKKQSSQQLSGFAQQHLQEIKRVLMAMNTSILEAFSQFSETVEQEIAELGTFSQENASEFFEVLNGAVQTFESNVGLKKQILIDNYYLFLRQNNQVVNPVKPTPKQRMLLSGLRSQLSEAILQVQALVLDITSDLLELDFASQTASQLAKFEQEVEQGYANILDMNEANANATWWQQLKGSGKRIMKKFGQDFAEAVKKEAEKTVKQAVTTFVKEQVNNIAGDIPGAQGIVEDGFNSFKKKMNL